jgi:hypothetical protein
MSNPNSSHRSLSSLGILGVIFSLMVLSCSSPKIAVAPDAQPTFKLSGDYHVMFFQVTGPENRIWKLYPKDNSVTLARMGEVRYGEVPANCEQAEPKTGPAPPLIEGGHYTAFAVIYDASPVNVEFVIKDGKTAQIAAKPGP